MYGSVFTWVGDVAGDAALAGVAQSNHVDGSVNQQLVALDAVAE